MKYKALILTSLLLFLAPSSWGSAASDFNLKEEVERITGANPQLPFFPIEGKEMQELVDAVADKIEKGPDLPIVYELEGTDHYIQEVQTPEGLLGRLVDGKLSRVSISNNLDEKGFWHVYRVRKTVSKEIEVEVSEEDESVFDLFDQLGGVEKVVEKRAVEETTEAYFALKFSIIGAGIADADAGRDYVGPPITGADPTEFHPLAMNREGRRLENTDLFSSSCWFEYLSGFGL